MSQHLTLMIPDEEVEHLKMENLMPPEYLDQLYRVVKELEHVSLNTKHSYSSFDNEGIRTRWS